MKHLKLTGEEKQMLADIEAGEFVQVENIEKEKQKAIAAAKNTFRKTKNINIRLTERVLSRLKIRAAEEGIPYQTLVSSILHKYVTK